MNDLISIWFRGPICAVAVLAIIASPSQAQPTAPTADDIRGVQAKYEAEKQRILEGGADKRFLAGLVDRADDMARKADAALKGGRLLQAAELFRQARWQLPYLPSSLPEHVARIFGNFRLRHGMEITAVAFSPDGKLLATGSNDRSVKLWDLANGHELRAFTKHTDQVRVLSFSPDGKTIASAGAEDEIFLWDVATANETKKIRSPGTYVTTLDFSPDGKYLASGHAGKPGGASGFVTIHELPSGELKRSIQDFRLLVQSVAFNKKGSMLAVGVGDGLVRLYEFPKMIENPNQPEFWAQQDNNGATYHVAFSDDERILVRTGADGIKVYNLAKPGENFNVGTPRRVFPNPGPDLRYQISLVTPDSKTLITGATDGLIRLFELETGQLVTVFRGHTGPIRSLALNAGGNQIASAGSDFMVRLWDFDITLQSRDFAGHEGPVWTAAFSPDGRFVASASADQTVRLWDVASGKTMHTLKGHAGPATVAVFTPDNKHVVSAGADRTIKIWEVDSGNLVRDLSGHTGTITALDVSPDGKQIASGGADRLVKLWDFDHGREIVTLKDHPSVVSAIVFHPDGKRIAVGNVDQTICVYNLEGKLQHRWPAHGIAVSGLAFSPNGNLLASCGADNVVRVWSMSSPGTNPTVLSGHTGPLSGIAFRKDNQHLVSSGADLSIKLWKLESDGAKELQTYRGHRDWVTSAMFSKDGYYVVSASVDRTLKIWEITSKDLPFLPEHTGAVDTIAFSPDGKLIASGGSDKVIKIWERATGVELATIRGHGSNVISLSFTPNSKILVSSGFDRTIRLWDPATGRELPRSPTQQQSWTGMLAASPLLTTTPDGKGLLVWVPGDQRYTTITGFDLEGNEKFTFNDQGRAVHSLCFAADGKTAATGAANGSVRVWDLDKRAPIPGGDWFFYDEKVSVADLAITPDSKKIIVTSEQGDIKIADIAKRAISKTLKGHPGRIQAVVVSADGKRFATLDAENTIKIWDTERGEELRRWSLAGLLQNRPGSVLCLAFSPDGKHLATGNTNTTLFVLEAP